MLPPAFIAQIARSARLPRAAARPLMLVAAAETRPERATLAAGDLRRQARRIAGWTLTWTLYQWWAVLGWPAGLTGAPEALLVSGALGLVVAAVWRDVGGSLAAPARPSSATGRVVPLRVPPESKAALEPPADLAA